eukprot:7048-Pelagococcus_subviridis.AAC.4
MHFSVNPTSFSLAAAAHAFPRPSSDAPYPNTASHASRVFTSSSSSSSSSSSGRHVVSATPGHDSNTSLTASSSASQSITPISSAAHCTSIGRPSNPIARRVYAHRSVRSGHSSAHSLSSSPSASSSPWHASCLTHCSMNRSPGGKRASSSSCVISPRLTAHSRRSTSAMPRCAAVAAHLALKGSYGVKRNEITKYGRRSEAHRRGAHLRVAQILLADPFLLLEVLARHPIAQILRNETLVHPQRLAVLAVRQLHALGAAELRLIVRAAFEGGGVEAEDVTVDAADSFESSLTQLRSRRVRLQLPRLRIDLAAEQMPLQLLIRDSRALAVVAVDDVRARAGARLLYDDLGIGVFPDAARARQLFSAVLPVRALLLRLGHLVPGVLLRRVRLLLLRHASLGVGFRGFDLVAPV